MVRIAIEEGYNTIIEVDSLEEWERLPNQHSSKANLCITAAYEYP